MKPIREFAKRPAVVCFALANLVFLLILVLRDSGALVPFELYAYDKMLRSRPDRPADSRIVIVEQTEEDIHRYGFPTPDEKFAGVLERLTEYGARAIGVDIYRDTPVPPGEIRLASILKRNPNIIWMYKFGGAGQHAVAPPKILAGTEQVGFNDLIDDPGGIIRRGLLFLDDGKVSGYSLPLRVVLRYIKSQGLELQPDPLNKDHVRLGKTTIVPFEKDDGGYVNADAAGYQFLLDFGDMSGNYTHFTLTQVLNGEAPASAIKDKLVLIGSTARSINDFFYTPYSVGLDADQRMFGVVVHARIASQLLRFALDGQPPIRVYSNFVEFGLIWIWCTVAGFAGLLAYSLWRFVLVAFLGTSAKIAICYVALLHGQWIPAVPSLVGFLSACAMAAAYLFEHEKRERGVLMRLFSSHVAKDIAEEIWERRDDFLEGGRLRPQLITVTIMFTDIKGFTTVSEKMRPDVLLEWLNEYMETMSDVVTSHRGVVKEYVGDAIMALFGAPIARQSEREISEDACNAVRCALEMERKMEQLNSRWRSQGRPVVAMRAGIFTGIVVAGSLGGGERMIYATIGDTVNTAARLESFDKTFWPTDVDGRVCRIIIGEPTQSRLTPEFRCIRIGEVELKGKDQKVAVYYVAKLLNEIGQSH